MGAGPSVRVRVSLRMRPYPLRTERGSLWQELGRGCGCARERGIGGDCKRRGRGGRHPFHFASAPDDAMVLQAFPKRRLPTIVALLAAVAVIGLACTSAAPAEKCDRLEGWDAVSCNMEKLATAAKAKADAEAKKLGCQSSTDFECLSAKGSKAASDIVDKAKVLAKELADKAAVAAAAAKAKADIEAKKLGCQSSTDFECLSAKGSKAASDIADKGKALAEDLADKAGKAAAAAKAKADAQAKRLGCQSSTDFECLSAKGTKAAKDIADTSKALASDAKAKADAQAKALGCKSISDYECITAALEKVPKD